MLVKRSQEALRQRKNSTIVAGISKMFQMDDIISRNNSVYMGMFAITTNILGPIVSYGIHQINCRAVFFVRIKFHQKTICEI